MEQKPHERQQAFNLYFQTDFTQQQIADILNVSRKTLYLWIKEGGWMRARYAAQHTPSVLIEQYYSQLANLNESIAQREDQPWPTKEEADTIRKLTMTVKQIRNGKQTASECIDVFHAFTDKLTKKDLALSKKVLPHMTEHIKDLTEDGQWLNFSEHRQREKKFDKEYGEWLLQQAQQTEKAPSDNEAPSSPGVNPAPSCSVDILPSVRHKSEESIGAQNAAYAAKQDATKPTPTNHITANDNSHLSTKKTGNEHDTGKENKNEISQAITHFDTQQGTPAASHGSDGKLPLAIDEIIALPPEKRPSPYREGNIIWVNDIDDVEKRLDNFGNPWGELKMADTIRRYPPL